ncbi:MAG: NUDIX hydrolase [Candidatus Aenigmarchaeota archaeon]|nr:NUDIX hydrolase [Candidatus Aenigmarchaeota archaeon]
MKKEKKPMLTVDGIIIEKEKILLIKRATQPYLNHWALPGGFVELNETLEVAVVREVNEETCLRTKTNRLIGAYSDPKRDPRGHTVSIVYFMKTTAGSKPKKTDEAKEIEYFDFDKIPEKIAFDHRKIINDAKKYLKSRNLL